MPYSHIYYLEVISATKANTLEKRGKIEIISFMKQRKP